MIDRSMQISSRMVEHPRKSLYDDRLYAFSKSVLSSRNMVSKSLYDDRLYAFSKSVLSSRNMVGKLLCHDISKN